MVEWRPSELVEVRIYPLVQKHFNLFTICVSPSSVNAYLKRSQLIADELNMMKRWQERKE